MPDDPHWNLSKVMGLIGSTVLVLFLLLGLTLLISAPETSASSSSKNTPVRTLAYSSPNHITNSANSAMDRLVQKADTAGAEIDNARQAIVSGTMSMLTATRNFFQSVGKGVASGISTIGSTVGSGIVRIVSIPVRMVSAVSSGSAVSSIIKPETVYDVLVIEPQSFVTSLEYGNEIMLASADVSSTHSAGATWPIRGRITTQFGVPHWPYQPTHTGIDISDGRASGITPIYPFMPGRVIDTVYSRYRLGNHVVVDHGDGMTSLYAHLSSIDVSVGQIVDQDTVLGLEGSTGASTGTHLHFEIRINNQAVDPRLYIEGDPL